MLFYLICALIWLQFGLVATIIDIFFVMNKDMRTVEAMIGSLCSSVFGLIKMIIVVEQLRK